MYLLKHSCFLAIFLCFAAANRIRDKLYVPLNNAAACFRRHNGTHQFGCSSGRSGNVGVIHMVEKDSDIEWLEKNATAGPYHVVLPFSMFNEANLLRFGRSEKVNGILLKLSSETEFPSYYSPDDTCPNRYFGYESCSQEWNSYGSSLLLKDWPFPIFYLEDEEAIKQIESCYQKYNAHDLDKQWERSLCALEMKSFMVAALNSESCMKRGRNSISFNPTLFCDPLGDRNIHWPLKPMTDDVKSIIMVIARLDANSLFDRLSPGANTAVTGLVTLIATATYLHQLNPSVKDTNIIFSLLNGESFDYIGSSRLVYDLKKDNFNVFGKKINLNEINFVIEFGQLGGDKTYFHEKNFKNSSMIDNLKNDLLAELMQNSVPPASVQSFLKENSSIPALVVANHGKTFENKYYNSILDDVRALNHSKKTKDVLVKSLAKVAFSFGNELFKFISGELPKERNLTYVEMIISEILPCYLETAKCPLFQAASAPSTKLPSQTLPLYVGVARVDNDITVLTGQLFAYLTGDQFLNMNSSICSEKHLIWMAGNDSNGVCINTTLKFTEALSPAFIIDDYNMKSGKYSTWTESVWSTLSVRMLLKPSSSIERLSIIIGSSVAGISFILVWFITSKADIIFDTQTVEL